MNNTHKGFSTALTILLVMVVIGGIVDYVLLNKKLIGSYPTSTTIPTITVASTASPSVIPSENTPPGWHIVDADSFTLSLPPGWKFTKLQGIDSYVVQFVGDGATLRFDFGWYSASPTKHSDFIALNQIVTSKFIGGYKAEIVTTKPGKSGVTAVYW